MVKQPRTIAIDDLLKQVQLEERIYRHRCVEAWAMTVPWTGFPLSQLLKIAEPLGSAKYIVFETAQDKTMPGLDSPFYPWPYIEGWRSTRRRTTWRSSRPGMYGKPLPPQNGGPIRLTLPWKYGFKSGKALDQDQFHREAADELLAGDPAGGVWFLGQREPGGARIRAGARRRSVCWAATKWCQRRSTTAMVSSSHPLCDRKNEKLFM